MLLEIADGVLVRQSTFCRTNAVVVRGTEGVIVIDPGVDGSDLDELVDDIAALGRRVTCGFATHPHWDHLLWHPAWGPVPRYGTARCVEVAQERQDDSRSKAERLAPGVRLDLIGALAVLPPGADRIAWDGPELTLIEHQAHAPGHAAIFMKAANVLVAGDMLSDVEVPLLDLDTADPLADYRAGLDRLASVLIEHRPVVVPGHGSVASGDAAADRLAADRAYLAELSAGRVPRDERVGPGATYGADWLPEAHDRQVGHVLRGE